jgi:hypothetical protein
MSPKPPILTEENGNLHIFHLPEEKHRYIITCDVSEGIGQDFSAFSVIDVTEKPFVQVARFSSNTVSIINYPNIIFSAAKKYNNAYVLVEVNDLGEQVGSTLFNDIGYENILFTRNAGPKGQQITFIAGNKSRPGVVTSVATKKKGCANLKYLIENKQLLIPDIDTQIELSNFVKIGNTFKASDSETDDIVMTLVLFGWLVKQPAFENLTKYKVHKYGKKEGQLQDGIDQIIHFNNVDEHGEYFPVNETEEEEKKYTDPEGNVWEEVEGWKYLVG